MPAELEIHVTDLLPAYVLDTLTDEELSQVVEHLAICSSCQSEYRSLQAVAEDLPLAVSQVSPRPQVKTSLMQAIHARQPVTRPAIQPTSRLKFRDQLRQRLPVLGLAFVMLITLGNVLLWRHLTLENQQALTHMRVVSIANTQNSPGAEGTLVMDPNGVYGTLVVNSLSVLDSSHRYQVWLVRDGQRVSGGLFTVNQDGYASLELQAPLPLTQYDSVGITIEPYAGSQGPTGLKVLSGAIPH